MLALIIAAIFITSAHADEYQKIDETTAQITREATPITVTLEEVREKIAFYKAERGYHMSEIDGIEATILALKSDEDALMALGVKTEAELTVVEEPKFIELEEVIESKKSINW